MKSFPPSQLKYQLASIKIQNRRLARIALWRSSFLIGCALGIGLVANLPIWKINGRSQIKIDGSQLVSKETVYDALKIVYPQLVWTIDGLALTRQVEAIPSIEFATANRQLVPPQITISLQEKIPVAVATSEGKIGFLNAAGEWIDRQFYANIGASSLPKLKVIDYKTQFRDRWQEIYQLITLYPELQINELELQQSGNVFLNTKLGRVFLGAKSSHIKRQFEIMARLENLPKQLDRSEIAYLDLSNPEAILIQKY